MAHLHNHTSRHQSTRLEHINAIVPTVSGQARAARSWYGARVASVAAAMLCHIAFVGASSGAIVRNFTANDSLHQTLGRDYLITGGALSGTGGAAGSIQVALTNGGIRLGSGGFWNAEYFICAAHTLQNAGVVTPSQITVATGPNAINNRGTIRTAIEIIPSPWGNGSNPNLPDIVAIRFPAIPGINQAIIGSASTGQMLRHIGFGNYGDSSIGEFFTDGNVRAFRAPVESFMSNGYSSQYYYSTRFEPGVSDNLNGLGRNIDSGGIVTLPDGRWAAIMSAATLGIGPGSTYCTRLDPPAVQAWLNTLSSSGPICNDIDFNNDGSLFDPQDIDAFLSVFSEGPCIPATATCDTIDFNNDTSLFDPCDIDSLLTVFGEGPCTLCGS